LIALRVAGLFTGGNGPYSSAFNSGVPGWLDPRRFLALGNFCSPPLNHALTRSRLPSRTGEEELQLPLTGLVLDVERDCQLARELQSGEGASVHLRSIGVDQPSG